MSTYNPNDPLVVTILGFLNGNESFVEGSRMSFETDLENCLAGSESFAALLDFYDDHEQSLPSQPRELDWEKNDYIAVAGLGSLSDIDLIDLVLDPNNLMVVRSQIFDEASDYWLDLIKSANPDFSNRLNQLPAPAAFIQQLERVVEKQEFSAVLLGPDIKLDKGFEIWEIPYPLSDAHPLSSPIPAHISSQILTLKVIQPSDESWLAIGLEYPLTIEEGVRIAGFVDLMDDSRIQGQLKSVGETPCLRFEEITADLAGVSVTIEYENDDIGLRCEIPLDPRWKEIDNYVLSDLASLNDRMNKLHDATPDPSNPNPLSAYYEDCFAAIRKNLVQSEIESDPKFGDMRIVAMSVMEVLKSENVTVPFPLPLVAVALVKYGLNRIFESDES